MITLNVTGDRAIGSAIARAVQARVEAVNRAIERGTNLVAREAQGLAPYDDGELRGSIRPLIERLAGMVVAGAPHAPYVEFGTGDLVEIPEGAEEAARAFYVNGLGMTPAQAFLRPALEMHRAEIVRDLREAMAGR